MQTTPGHHDSILVHSYNPSDNADDHPHHIDDYLDHPDYQPDHPDDHTDHPDERH